jgi:ketosteroid isomerase-like protein
MPHGTPRQHPPRAPRGRAATFASFAEEFERSGHVQRRSRSPANAEHVVALLHATADREDKRLSQDYVIVFHMRDGKVDAA